MYVCSIVQGKRSQRQQTGNMITSPSVGRSLYSANSAHSHLHKCAGIMKPHLAFCIIVSIGAPRVEAVTEGFTRGELFAICGYMWIEIRYGLLWFCFFQLVSQCYRLESNAKLLSVTIVYKTIDIRQTTACACCVLRTSEISLHQHTCIIPPLELRPHQGRLGYHLFDA